MKLVLASIVDWDGTTQIGVFSDREKAFTACKNFLLKTEGTYPTKIDLESENYISYSIKGLEDKVALATIELDKPLN